MITSLNLYSSSFGALVEGNSVSTPLAEYLMFLTSFMLLLPAKYALTAGRPWHAALFLAMTLSCAVYHVCDAKATTILGAAPLCTRTHLTYMTLADHGCAYFCFLQMGFLLLGPEDHNLQWPQDPSTSRKPWARVPTSVAVNCRALPVFMFLVFMLRYAYWQKFHFHMVFMSIAILLNGVGQFWLSPTRREHIPKIIFGPVFCRRLVSLGLLPLLLCTSLFLFMERSESAGLSHAAWHVVVALLALNVQRTIYYSLPDPLHTLLSYLMQEVSPVADIHSSPPNAPVVAHYSLSSIALVTGFTLFANYATCLLMPAQTGESWTAFGLSMFRGMQQWQSSYIIVIGSLLLLVAVATTFALIGTLDMETEGKQTWRSHWRSLGCSVGSSSLAFGLLAIASWLADAVGLSVAPQLQSVALAATVCAAAGGMLLVSFSEHYVHITSTSATIRTGVALRCAMAAFMAVAAAGYVSSLHILHIYDALSLSTIGIPGLQAVWLGLALCQHTMLALLMVWPLTYCTEVREQWTPKVPKNNKWRKCLLTNSAAYYENGMGMVF